MPVAKAPTGTSSPTGRCPPGPPCRGPGGTPQRCDTSDGAWFTLVPDRARSSGRCWSIAGSAADGHDSRAADNRPADHGRAVAPGEYLPAVALDDPGSPSAT